MQRDVEAQLTDDIDLALRLADLAADSARPLFEAGVSAEPKADGSPVTIADLTVEREIISVLAAERPDDAITCEEAGSSGSSHRRWLIDPIDGTEMFVASHPSWGTHIALEIDGTIALGVITRPTRRRRWWAARGAGAHRCEEGGTRAGVVLHVSDVTILAESRISVWSEGPSAEADLLAPVTQLIEPAYDDYLDVVEGRLEAVVFPRPEVAFAWDHAPAVVLVTESGGRFRAPTGGTRIDLGTGVFSNGLIDPELDAVIARRMTIGALRDR